MTGKLLPAAFDLAIRDIEDVAEDAANRRARGVQNTKPSRPVHGRRRKLYRMIEGRLGRWGLNDREWRRAKRWHRGLMIGKTGHYRGAGA